MCSRSEGGIVKIDLSGRVAVVTGGTAGIGLAAVRLFLEAGGGGRFLRPG